MLFLFIVCRGATTKASLAPSLNGEHNGLKTGSTHGAEGFKNHDFSSAGPEGREHCSILEETQPPRTNSSATFKGKKQGRRSWRRHSSNVKLPRAVRRDGQ